MKQKNNSTSIPQYSLAKILLVWVAAALPMGILGWIVAPALAANTEQPAFIRLAVITVGLIWQFVLVMWLIYREAGTLRWSALKQRLWLSAPRSPKTGKIRYRLWWWLVPILLLTAFYQMQIGGLLSNLWTSVFPFFAEPEGFSFKAVFATPEARSQLIGAWGFFGLFVATALFNTVLGEELLFRGLLLPRMKGVFGRWDWMMNGLLFGLYHIHQPWGMLSSVVLGALFFALPSRYFRTAWFGIIAHSGQSVFFLIIILGIVLGLA